jgi:ABC-2 type transport system permease protein
VRRSVFWHIVRRDLRISMGLIVTALVLGIIAFALAGHGKVASFVSTFLLICAGIAPGVFICSLMIWTERKDKSRLFSLSLPISPPRYALAKATAASIAYLAPWAALAATALIGYTLLSAPSGPAPLMTALWLFLLDQFCIFLCITLVTDSDLWFTAAIVFVNTSIAPFFFVMTNIPSIGPHINGPTAFWSSTVITILAVELTVAAAVVAFTIYRISRTRDFV